MSTAVKRFRGTKKDKERVQKTIRELRLPTTGIYYGRKIGEMLHGYKIVAWWRPGHALTEYGRIFRLKIVKRK